MKLTLKSGIRLAAATCALVVANTFAQGAYPCAVVKIISPYPPGGSTDILSRLIAPGLSKELGATVIVENKAGASSNIGTEFVANAPADGCTLLLGNNTGVVINRNLYKLRTDPVKGLAPVIEVASVPLVLYVNSAVSANNLAELIDLVRKNPGKFSYASGGSGSPQHLMGELLKIEEKLDILHVPYKGQGPALADVSAGQVQMAFETTTAIAAQLNSGRIRPIATTGSVRSKGLENVPTMKELGYPNFVIENWYGVFAPAKTPDSLVQRLNKSIDSVLRTPDVAAILANMGSSNVEGSAAQFNQFIQNELPYWESLVKRSGATID